MKTFVQYGAGNIGRGFIGALFSAAGYRVQFIDVNLEIINALNSRGSYPVEIVSPKGSRDVIVEGVSGIDGNDTAAVAKAIAGASLMATAVGVNILPHIVKNIAAGLRLRWEKGVAEPLNIIICENLLDADRQLFRMLSEELAPEKRPLLRERVGLVEASIGRMVPVMTEEMKKGDCLRVCVERYGQLPVDKAAFKGEPPKLPGLHPFTPFEYFIRRKLFVHNMGHSLTAYAGSLIGLKYIWQSVQVPVIKLLAQRAMTESAKALSSRFGVPLADILQNIDDLLLRFSNVALGDTVERVGRDTRRKLSADDRFCAAARLCEAEGVEPVYICAGIACGLVFKTPPGDEGTAYIHDLLEKKGLDAVLAEHCGLDADSLAAGYVRGFYGLLKDGCTPEDLLARAESEVYDILERKNVI